MPLIPIPPPAPFIPHVYKNAYWVDPVNGLDTNNGTFEKPYKTITKTLTVVDNASAVINLAPGTYSENVVVTANNVDFVGMPNHVSGLINLTGSWTFSNNVSSIRCSALSFANSVTFSGTSSVYLTECNCAGTASFSKANSGYLEIQDSDFTSSPSFSVSLGIAALYNSRVLYPSIAGGTMGFYYCPTIISPIASGGTLAIYSSNVYATTVGGTAITTSGTAVLVANNVTCFDSASGSGAVSVGGTAYSFSDVQYLRTSSTITAASFSATSTFDNLRSLGNILPGSKSTASSGTAITLSGTSEQWQTVTGSTAQTVRLPSTSGLIVGTSWTINNISSATVTVQTSAGAAVTTIAAGSNNTFTYTGVSTNGGWSFKIPTQWGNFTINTAFSATTTGTIVPFNVSTGNVTNASGRFSLKAGITYQLTGQFMPTAAANIYGYWGDSTGAALTGTPYGFTNSLSNNSSSSAMIYTPATDQQVTFVVRTVSGTQAMNLPYMGATVTQVGG